MSRSGSTEECEHIELYRANVDRTIRSKRGQAFLLELADAMDAMPEKSLISGELINADGQCCTLGVVCQSRGLEASKIDYEDQQQVGDELGISRMMAAEIAYENDEGVWAAETDEQRWQRMRKWVYQHLKKETKT